MSDQDKQPIRASLEYLKKLAKKRLDVLRESQPNTKLADAQLLVAREAGFASWRKLKAEFDQRDALEAEPFFQLIAEGNVARLQELLKIDARLANAVDPGAQRKNFSALHTAVRANQLGVVELLIEFGANVQARESMDNATALHFAANLGYIEIARALIVAGADVNDSNDSHQFAPIGWASQLAPHRSAELTTAMVNLLRAHGAKHHVFSAISVGTIDELRDVLQENATALERRSPTIRMSPLAWAVNNLHFDKIPVLLEFGANIDEANDDGRTVLAEAILAGSAEAVNVLRAAGASEPTRETTAEILRKMPDLAASVSRAVPMISVADIPHTLSWYTALGFTEVGRYWEHNELRWATMTFGNARVMLSTRRTQQSTPHQPDLKLWFYTTRIDEVHSVVRARQMELAYESLAGKRDRHDNIQFIRDINDTPYSSREFAIRDLNGYHIYFIQLSQPGPAAHAEQSV